MFPRNPTRRKGAFRAIVCIALILGICLCRSVLAQSKREAWSFRFGTETAPAGTITVPPTALYSEKQGYGFEPASESPDPAPLQQHDGFCTSAQPFYFSVALPEGNYKVTVTLGDPQGESVTTVKSELRRLMLQGVRTDSGATVQRTFTVNVRTPFIQGGSKVHLKVREINSEWRDWDEKLTLEFNDTRPCLRALEITRNDTAPTLFLMGDSTVCDQPREPWNSWGQMLPRFFTDGLAVANYAESGESLRSTLGAKRLDKVLSRMKTGDYLFIQFGHNDMKEKGEGVGAFTTYKADLKRFVAAARERGGIPVLVTPMHRKRLDAAGQVVNTLGDYPEAVRQAAQEEKTPFIDLNAMSATLYAALGPARLDQAFQDGTHHNNYGSYELARCIVQGIRQNRLSLTKFLAPEVPPFDPAHPDAPDMFLMPKSPGGTLQNPLGDSAQEQSAPQAAVTVNQTATTFTLANGFVTARIDRQSGDLVSLKYQDKELMGTGSGHPAGYWSHTPTRGGRTVSSITIDPANSAGERAEVSVKGFYAGTALGQGPGGSVAADIEIRYALGRTDHGLYTYSIFDHQPDYPATSIGEARFGAKLNDQLFDYMAIDAKRSKIMITAEDWNRGTDLNMKEARRMTTGRYAGQVEHKYDYSAVQFDTPAFGWYSTQQKIGLWFVNPTIEYLSGGATKVELTGHRDVSTGAAPTLLNYWRGSHYGGAECSIAQGEAWTRVIGPFLIYCNTEAAPDTAWKDAQSQATRETAKWPFDWVSGVDYPHKDQRGSVTGRIVLRDLQAPGARLSNLLVGLAAPDYPLPPGVRGRATQTVDWQSDAKFYQFWARADPQGGFRIPNVRPGKYTLHAIADGVLGEYAQTEIVVTAGKPLDLGALTWKPVRYGQTLWEIGTPNRSAAEFRHGDHYWKWGLYLKYSQEFPEDVHFVIGKSDPKQDWNYAQCPRDDGKPTTWSVTFHLDTAPHGKATLRLALAATSAHRISVAVNETAAGDTGALPDTATIRRDGIRGYWYERDVAFDAGLMHAGDNVLSLTIPPGGVMSGVEYDYLRLELAPTP